MGLGLVILVLSVAAKGVGPPKDSDSGARNCIGDGGRTDLARCRRVRRVATVLVGLLTILAAAPARADQLPPVRHAFVIVLENADYDTSFGPSSGLTYLNQELLSRGQLLRQYYGTSHESLGNYLTMISGQAPNPDTQGDCNFGFRDVAPGVMGADGQVMGTGCVY